MSRSPADRRGVYLCQPAHERMRFCFRRRSFRTGSLIHEALATRFVVRYLLPLRYALGARVRPRRRRPSSPRLLPSLPPRLLRLRSAAFTILRIRFPSTTRRTGTSRGAHESALPPGRADGGADDADARGGQHAGKPVSDSTFSGAYLYFSVTPALKRCGVREAGSACVEGRRGAVSEIAGISFRARPR